MFIAALLLFGSTVNRVSAQEESCGTESKKCCVTNNGVYYCTAPWIPANEIISKECFCRQTPASYCQITVRTSARYPAYFWLVSSLKGVKYKLLFNDAVIHEVTTDKDGKAEGFLTRAPREQTITITAISENPADKCIITPVSPYGAYSCNQCGCFEYSESPIMPGDPVYPIPSICPSCDANCQKCLDQDKSYTALGCLPSNDPNEFAKWVIQMALGIGGGIALIMAIFGGVGVITSGGDTKKLQASRERITGAIAGLLFIIFAVFFLEIIGTKILNLPGLVP